ncbi:hypothetical protein [Dentiradicibacter hellwigii]|uniref:Uncharacterized protein n=1 Tax=Dentiradicibacter hellwigii TaxID=3149053 RepID=A0ABV4UFZ2_9RHOO
MEKINGKKDILEYLKTLLEGSNIIHANKWIINNQEALKKFLTRSEYLKIKFEPIKFAKAYLAENLIKYKENIPHCRYEEYLMTFTDAALQQDGSLKEDWYSKIFDGVFLPFFLGNKKGTEVKIQSYLKKHQGKKSILSTNVIDLIFFAEMISTQNIELSKLIIESISNYFANINILFTEVENAKINIYLTG